MKTLQEQIVSTRRKANRETLMFPNEIRADIMNHSIGARDIAIAKDPAKHEIYVNATFFDGRVKAWKYRLYINEFHFGIDKEDLNPPKINLMGDDDLMILRDQLNHLKDNEREFIIALRFKKEKEQDEED